LSPPLLALALAATLDVPAGGDLAAALSLARAGDTVRLAAGDHQGALGELRGVRVLGAGAGSTVLLAPEGEDGATLLGDASVEGLSLVAGPGRCAVVAASGPNALRDVALVGEACGLRVSGGRVEARDVDAVGRRGIHVTGGAAKISGGSAHGEVAGVAAAGGALSLVRFAVTGPSSDAAVSASGGTLFLDSVVVRAPGATGIAVAGGASVEARVLAVVGGSSGEEIPGACLLSRRGALRILDGLLARCGGAALVAAGGTAALTGVDAAGGVSGCFQGLSGARMDLSGNTCIGRGPGLLLAGGAAADTRMNLWASDPVRYVDCGSGAVLTLGPGEPGPIPCAGSRPPAAP